MSINRRINKLTLKSQLKLLLLAACAITSNAGVAQALAPQTKHAVISSTAAGPYFQLDIPTNIYPGSLHPDLHDVRVRNADGDLLSFAWADMETSSAKLESKTVSAFPLKDIQSNSFSSFRQNADGSLTALSQVKITRQNPVPAWIIDVSKIKGKLLQARFSISEQVDGMFGFTLESSNDLKNWQSLGSEQLVQLRHQGSVLQNLGIRLHHVSAQYLRLRWNNPADAPWLDNVSIDSQQEVYTPPVLQWSKPIPVKTCAANYCEYSIPDNTPIDSLRLLVSEPNTLLHITVLAQVTTTTTPVSSYHHRHSPLYPLHVLRHQKRNTEVQVDQQVWLNDSLVYKINLPNGEVKSRDLLMDGASYKTLRLQTDNPYSKLGKTLPEIQIASLPRRLVFLARGKPPYQLEWGMENKEGAAIPLTTLIPKMDLTRPVQADIASVEIADYVAPQAAIKPAVDKTPAKEHKPWLWAALGVGLLLLGGMVWSLLKSISEDKAKT
ncbi:DUF3999 family protein [Undibacterium pigrum]|uniref:Uncharacterized protein DUF3999 n=1 Tax=Undibacterium pigrum TaxID=401470 RepID=A0A318JHN1_9BURK|nr:DUF3999 family protein [Undibacterium pigrum]PXX47295.1 uncharacterized protein DUF3999 [Undibacterium pigrum]